MRTETIALYTFEELEPAIQRKILDTFRYRFLPSHWADSIIQEWQHKLEAIGFQDVAIRFSVGGSQGDGASFTASGIDLHILREHMQEDHLCLSEKEVSWNGYGFFIQRINHRYFHEKSVSVAIPEQAEPLPAEEKGIALLTDKLFTKIHSLSIQLHAELFEVYCSYFKDAYVQSKITDHQLEFYKNGLLYISP